MKHICRESMFIMHIYVRHLCNIPLAWCKHRSKRPGVSPGPHSNKVIQEVNMTYICNRMDIPAPFLPVDTDEEKSFSRGSSQRRVTQWTSSRWLSTGAGRLMVWKCFPNFLCTSVPITKKSSASIASRMRSDLRRKGKNSWASSTREVVVILPY